MKKIFISACILLCTITLSSCKSKEEKALEIIKNEMFKTLYDFESYEPIETRIDSSFSSLYTDTTVLGHGYMIAALLSQSDEYIDKMKDAKSTMEIWGDSYSSYSRNRYNEAKKEFDENLNKAMLVLDLIKLQSDSIRSIANNYVSEFNGWKVSHKFRCKTKGGNPTIGDYIYIFDKDMKSIIYKEDIDNDDLNKVKKLIKEAVENKDNDNLENQSKNDIK